MASDDASKAEQELLEEFKERIKLPDNIEEEMERARSQRAYVKDCMLRTDSDAVSTNFVLRYLNANMADLFPREPRFSVNPENKMWGPAGIDPTIPQIADTAERLMNFHAKAGDFKVGLREFAREALTVPMGIIKLIWHEDFTRDPIGVRHRRDTDELLARYTRLYDSYKAGKFDKDCADYQRLIQLADSLRPIAVQRMEEEFDIANVPINVIENEDGSVETDDPRYDEMQKVAKSRLVPPKYLPVVPTFQYFSFDLVEMEDFRWDWNVNRFSDYWTGRWVAHRVRMTGDELAEKFGLKPDEQEEEGDGDEDEDTTTFREDIEENQSRNTVDVWEMQDAETRTVYVFTEKHNRFLAKYEPTVTWSRFFTLFPLQFNPVAGEFIGVSNIDLQRPLQDEINERRTHEKHYLRATLPTYGISAGALGPKGLNQLRQRVPFDVIEFEITDIPKLVEFKAAEVQRDWFDISKARSDLELVSGRPVAGIGGTSPNVTATQTAFAGEQLGSQVSQNRALFTEIMTLIGNAMFEMLLQTTDEYEVKYIVGPGAVWPTGNRDAMFAQMNMMVSSYMDAEPNKDQLLQRYQTFIQIAASLGLMPNPMTILPQLATEVLKLPMTAQEMLIMPPQMQQGQPGGEAPAQPPGPEPGVQGQPMQATPSMASLPGRAQTVQNAAATQSM